MLALAYTYYSFFEWALIAFDVMFDSVAELDFKAANLQVSGLYFSSLESELKLYARFLWARWASRKLQLKSNLVSSCVCPNSNP